MSDLNSTWGGPPTPMTVSTKHGLQVPSQLLHHNTTTVNQLLGLPGMFSTFVARDLRNLRILALTASSSSIVACAVSIFFLINIDRRKRVFRHDLVFFLIICDLVKALVLMIYPLVILVQNEVYAQPGFYNTLGWFTAYCVEGADLAIFFFAIHFALLIFTPSWKWRHGGSGRMEGGLYCVRAYIWPITALVPVLLASLAFVNFELLDEEMLKSETTVVLDNDNYKFPYYARLGGYKPYSAWCYLPPYPAWYKLVLSWGFRYFLIVFILVLYISIYVFVRRESNKIKNQIFEFKERPQEGEEVKATTKKQHIGSKLERFLWKPAMRFLRIMVGFLSFSLEDTQSSRKGPGSICSSRSFYATEDSTSSDQVPDVRMSFDFISGHRNDRNSYSSRKPSNDVNGRKYSFGLRGGVNTYGDVEQQIEDTSDRRGSGQESFLEELDNEFVHAPQALVSEGHTARTQGRHFGHTCLSPIQSLSVPQQNQAENNTNKQSQGSAADVKGVQASFQKQTYAAMKRRRAQIQKNLRSIFIYPFSYIAIWIFPLIVDITQYRYEIVHGPIVWLIYIATIAQPINGLVDTLVFVYREKPWKCSWEVVQGKELSDTYSLKGGLSEKDIAELYYSDLGKKGWYYCGRFDKFSCWRHKPQRWKRAAWYTHRFFQGLLKNDYNFEDHCDELALIHTEHMAERQPSSPNALKNPFDQRERQVSFPSDSTTASAPLAHDNSIIEPVGHVKVSAFWRFIHLFPMLHGIDLDELNRELRHRPSDNDFVLPGLKQALKSPAGSQRPSDTPIFKPGYTVAKNKNTPMQGADELLAQSQTTHPKFSLNPDSDFSDVVRGQSPGSSEKDDKESHPGSSQGDKMGMLAFLNDLMQ